MTTGSDQQDLLDIKQAAKFLNVSETSLRRWTNSGHLASLRVGRRRERRFRRDDLVAFMEHHPVVGAATGWVTPAGRWAHKSGAADSLGQTFVAGVSVPIGAHFCGVYDTDEGRTAQVAAFLADGLSCEAACILLANPKARDSILARLKDQPGSTVRTEIDGGGIIVSEYAATAQAQWEYFESVLLAATRGGARTIRLAGDVSGGPLGNTLDEIIHYELGYHRLIARRFPMVTLCTYDARCYSGSDLLRIFKCHGDNFTFPAERLLA